MLWNQSQMQFTKLIGDENEGTNAARNADEDENGGSLSEWMPHRKAVGHNNSCCSKRFTF